MKPLQTIILAAGKGTRMKSDIPKVLHPVCGKPIIRYVTDIARAVGSLKTYVVVGHQSQAVRAYLGEEFRCVEQEQLLGTADAVKCALKAADHLDGDVLILCGDTPLLNVADVRRVVKKQRSSGAACTVLTACVADPSGYGRIVRQGRNMAAIREQKDASVQERKINEINVGVYCCDGRKLSETIRKISANSRKKEFYLTDMIEILVRQGEKVETVLTDTPQEGLGVNTRAHLAEAEDIMRHRIIARLMESGVTIVDPKTTFIASDARIGKDTVIRPFTFIENNVKVGARCVIGPFARLRSGTRVANRVEIGNFAEVNNSRIGSGCFMKHFSYLGDATLGDNVNIGAGTVTANFDGVRKHPTRIGSGAFIGSDSILVAPVVVKKNAATGAGCVVTSGTTVPEGYVAVGVPAKVRKRRTCS